MVVRIAFIICLWSFYISASAQLKPSVYSSFHADPKGVFWMKRFDQPGYSSDGLRERMVMHLKRNPAVRDVRVDDSGNLVASIRNLKIDYKRLGVPPINASNKVAHGRWKGKIKVQFADGQYQIIVDNLEYFARIYRFHVPKAQAPLPEFEGGTVTKIFLNRDKSFFKHSSLKDLDMINFILTDQFSLIEERLINPSEVVAESVSAGR